MGKHNKNKNKNKAKKGGAVTQQNDSTTPLGDRLSVEYWLPTIKGEEDVTEEAVLAFYGLHKPACPPSTRAAPARPQPCSRFSLTPVLERGPNPLNCTGNVNCLYGLGEGRGPLFADPSKFPRLSAHKALLDVRRNSPNTPVGLKVLCLSVFTNIDKRF